MKSKTRDTTAIKLRAAKVPPVGVRKGQWQVEREAAAKQVPGKPKPNKKRTRAAIALSPQLMLEAAKDKAAGMTNEMLATKYAVSEAYIGEALQRLYVRSDVGRQILKGVLLENAIATGMHARKNIESLSGMQATVAAGIFTDRFVQLDKHIASVPREVDFAEIAKVGQLLEELDAEVAIDPEERSLLDEL